MSTFTDGVVPSVNPGPDDGPDPDARGRGADRYPDGDASDTGSAWLREEIQRRMAASRSGSGGRHARHEAADPSSSAGYVPRHSVATPGPGAPRPDPAAAPMRAERRRAGTDAWSGPRDPQGGDDGRYAVDNGLRGHPAGAPVSDAVSDESSLLLPLDPAARTDPAIVLSDIVGTRTVGPSTSEHGTVDAGTAPPDAATRGASTADPVFTARTPAPITWERRGRPPSEHGKPPQREAELAGPDEPEADGQTRRVRVVLAERKGVAKPVRTVVDIQEDTGVGELLRRNLIGSQLAVALRFAVGAGLTLAVLPLLFFMFPEIGRMNVLGLRVPWLVLGVLVYPFLLGLGLWHTRTAERVEQNFADHVQD